MKNKYYLKTVYPNYFAIKGSIETNDLQVLFFDIFLKENFIYIISPVLEKLYSPNDIIIKSKQGNILLYKIIQKGIPSYPHEGIAIYIFKLSDDIQNINNNILDLEVSYLGKKKHFKLKKTVIENNFLILNTLFLYDIYLFEMFYEYYTNLGVNHFYMYYNGIIDNNIVKLMNKKNVTLIEWNFKYWWRFDNKNRHYAQIASMHHCLYKYGKNNANYIIYNDLDEYFHYDNQKIIDILKSNKYDHLQFDNIWSISLDLTIPTKFPSKFIISKNNEKKMNTIVFNKGKYRLSEGWCSCNSGQGGKNIYKCSSIEFVGIHGNVRYNKKTINAIEHLNMYHFYNWSKKRSDLKPFKKEYLIKELNDFKTNQYNCSVNNLDNEFLKYSNTIFVISLKKSKLRRQNMITQLDNSGISNYEFFDAYNGNDISIKQLQNDNILDYDKNLTKCLYKDNKYRLGTIGCALSHWSCWKEIIKRNLKWAVILEDDICFCQDFKERFVNLIKRCDSVLWTTIHLHSSHGLDKKRTKADFLPSYETTHESIIYNGYFECGGAKAYIISKKAIELILMKKYQKINKASDGMLGSCSSPYLIPKLHYSFIPLPYLIEINRQSNYNKSLKEDKNKEISYNYTNSGITTSDRFWYKKYT